MPQMVKASACNVGDPGLNPGSGKSPGKGNGNPLQYSCLENSMDGGASWLESTGLQSRTQLNDFTCTFHFQASLSMGFFWQECLSGLPFLSPMLNEDFVKYVISSNSSQKAKAVHSFSPLIICVLWCAMIET